MTDAWLLDTNILVYAVDRTSDVHDAARRLVTEAHRGAIECCVCPQVLYEFYSVLTRSTPEVEAPLSSADALTEVGKFVGDTKIWMITRGPNTLRYTLWLLELFPHICGRSVHDVVLVATMLENGITRLYTRNTRHFGLFSDRLTVENPLDT